MAAKPVVDGFDKQLAGRVRFVRADINSPNGKKIAAKVGLDMVPTFIGYDAKGVERWRMSPMPNRLELWSRLIKL
ncbi:MAG TPA: hypothetical protein VMW62_17640 [Chloroflexota bacterium]|nr:hypothetical protein [Chloroflexota bacterium]